MRPDWRVPTYGPPPKQRTTTNCEPKITFRRDRSRNLARRGQRKHDQFDNNLYLYTEGGINRRLHSFAKRQPEILTLNCVPAPGLTSATAKVTSRAVPVVNGLLPR